MNLVGLNIKSKNFDDTIFIFKKYIHLRAKKLPHTIICPVPPDGVHGIEIIIFLLALAKSLFGLKPCLQS